MGYEVLGGQIFIGYRQGRKVDYTKFNASDIKKIFLREKRQGKKDW